jgi:branched-subunit amino acid aminotransferase/4-amino-4-deoxychorismate lyase
MTQLWCNGQWIDAFDPGIPPTDRVLTHGLGLFETILAVDGAPVFVERHIQRLERSCRRLGWSVEIPAPGEIMAELLARSHLARGRARIRLTITGGSGTVHDLTPGGDRIIRMTALPAPDPPANCAVNLSPWLRNERSPLAGLKCASYAENLVALDHARRQGYEETVFLNTAGHVCEAATANVFLVNSGALLTASVESGCLPGITRGVVIELAKSLGIACSEGDLTPADLASADEIFLTSSIRGLMGVSRFGPRILPPGKITTMLREAWREAVLRDRTG